MNRFPVPLLFGLGFAACAGGMGFALFVQYGLGYEPCPLCVAQRVAMIGAGLVFLIGMLHAPKARGQWGYAIGAALAAGSGMAIAARHVWIQNLPADQVPSCGPTVEYLLDMLPFTEALMTILRGDGNCAIVDVAFLGISLPGWTLVAFTGMTLYALAIPFLVRKEPA